MKKESLRVLLLFLLQPCGCQNVQKKVGIDQFRDAADIAKGSGKQKHCDDAAEVYGSELCIMECDLKQQDAGKHKVSIGKQDMEIGKQVIAVLMVWQKKHGKAVCVQKEILHVPFLL